MPDLTIQAADGSGSFSAYCAMPGSGSGPGLVVLQEIFGVNHFMREVCDDFAGQGYVAVCPDLFWRVEPGIELTDKTQEEWDRAFELMNAFLPKFQEGVADIQATITHVRGMDGCTGKVGTVPSVTVWGAASPTRRPARPTSMPHRATTRSRSRTRSTMRQT